MKPGPPWALSTTLRERGLEKEGCRNSDKSRGWLWLSKLGANRNHESQVGSRVLSCSGHCARQVS